jgi:hypothetical protein
MSFGGVHDRLHTMSFGGPQRMRQLHGSVTGHTRRSWFCYRRAFTWVWNGTYSADQFDEAVATEAQELVNPPQDYLMEISLLADYLAGGPEQMGRSAIAAEDDLLGFDETEEAPEV